MSAYLKATVGLSVVIQRFPAVYLAVRFMGAAYLIYLGSRNLFSRLRHASGNTVTSESESITTGVAIRSGFLNNFLNPKVSLFFFGFFRSLQQASCLPTLLAVSLLFFSW